jgi:hypothetical protein
MATTTAAQYFLGHIGPGGRVRDHRELGSLERAPRFWAIRLQRFWPANRPGQDNDPWKLHCTSGRDRGAVCLRVAPLLRSGEDLEASAIRIFDVQTNQPEGDAFPPVFLHSLLPAKVRAGDGLLIQADLVDISLFTDATEIMAETGRILDRRQRPASHLSIDVTDTIALLSGIGNAVLSSLWYGVLKPTGVDERAWDPSDAQFVLYGPSLDATPQAHPGAYVLAGLWDRLDLSHAHYDRETGLRATHEHGPRIPANVLEFELLALREV